MPYPKRTSFPLLGGVFKDDTPSVAEGYLIDSNGIRFRRKKWQTIAGYEALSTETFDGIVRGAHAWADRNGAKIVGFATQAKFYSYYAGELLDITPLKGKGTLDNPFTTENGSPTVLVTHLAHGLKDGDTVSYSLADAVGGITLDGDYTVTVRDPGAYFVTHSSNATSTVADGGGYVEWTAAFDEGRLDGIGGFGYGTGTYGTGVYGKTSTGDIHPRQTAIGNWGEFGLFLPQNGALFEYQPQFEYPELVSNGDFASSDDWTEGTGWSIGSGVATATAGTASDLEQDLTGNLSGGFTYDLTATWTVSADSAVFRVTSNPAGSPSDIQFGEPFVKSATYTRTFTAPSAPTFVQFAKSATFAGTLDDVSIKVKSTAYRIHDAPQYSRWMFVDKSRVILLGTVDVNGVFNAMHMRWCDPYNNRTWDPGDDNGAGFETLTQGSDLVGGLALRNENLVFSNVAAYTMRPTSSGYDIQLMSGAAGLIAPRAVAEMDGVAFWWGTDRNFHIYRGGTPQILDCSMRRDVMDNLATNQQGKIAAFINPAFSEVGWLYPDSQDGDGLECSRAIIYNWSENVWYSHQIARTDWVKPGVFPNPVAFGTDNKIYQHEFGRTANGDALSWFAETGALDLGEGDHLFNLMGLVPDFEEQQGSITIEIYTRNFVQDDWTLAATKTAAIGARELWVRLQARQIKLKISQSAMPAFARFGRIQAMISPSGAKR